MSLLDVTGLTIRYGDSTVVDGVELFVERGESVGVVGESGSGKSQSALAIPGLLPNHAEVSGSIEFDGEQLLGKTETELNKIRAARIGFVFQDPMLALNPYVRIGKQIRQVVLAHDVAKDGEADARVLEMLERVGLPDPVRQFDAYSHELSGGMRQRVMIAAALIAGPDLLIADEPTTALDVTVQAQILDLLEELRDETALLLITHDLGVVAGHCEHMVVLEDGKVVEAGPTTSVFAAPRHAHTKALLAAAPRIDKKGPVTFSDGEKVTGPFSGKTLLAAEDVSVAYKADRHSELKAVEGASLTIREGETLAVVGESGSGKSSLVRAILGLVAMKTGIVVYAGEPLVGDVDSRPLEQRRELQLVYQDPIAALDPQMRVGDIIAEPLVVHAPAMSAVERTANVIEMLEKVGLDGSFAQRYPHQLSGGQAQRVAIARALILDPHVLICDEAVAALDGTVRMRVLRLLQRIQAETGLSIIFISHDLAVVRSISHSVAVMYEGKLVETADNEKLFESPQHEHTRALIRAAPIPDPRASHGSK